MFSHITIGANDVLASKRFYDATLAAFGISPGVLDGKGRAIYRTQTGMLMVTTPINGKAATGANGGTISFTADSQEAVEAWHDAGLANGGTTCEDPPGVRKGSRGLLYLAYLRDPSGNKLCALHSLPAS